MIIFVIADLPDVHRFNILWPTEDGLLHRDVIAADESNQVSAEKICRKTVKIVFSYN